ncbi:hypothetical protein [Fundicoccus culcitae]|uniref:Prenyltransferase n=1 Tax=Fundicoccus culcitae TaxID=2969821 RepID=A0ABY5P7G5_9LACT|nr:hypothetical protein [Fundicoccus culcitae]UUX34383.1 hypothetical protein NRE15_01660 [Fundicoccus culcitae]
MKPLIKLLQHPLLKIIAAPFSYIFFGSIVSITNTQQFNWLDFFLLYLIVLCTQLIDQYFFIRFAKQEVQSSSAMIIIVLELLLIAFSIIFIVRQHWIINLLLILYLIFIHIQYFPFDFTRTFYHFVLNVFFNSFVLQTIAFYTQTQTVSNDFLYSLLPLVIFNAGLQLEQSTLRGIIAKQTDAYSNSLFNKLSIGLCMVAIALAVYFSLPSQSYYLTQILLVIVSLALILPLLVSTDKVHQAQNKINYFSSVMLIFNLVYALSYLY